MDVASDGSWLATGGGDGTMRIWDTASWQEHAVMRMDAPLNGCAWIGTTGISVAGESGLYLFDFLTSAAAAGQVLKSRPAI
jgi:WD40 repeat protein